MRNQNSDRELPSSRWSVALMMTEDGDGARLVPIKRRHAVLDGVVAAQIVATASWTMDS
jgi:hypothetical protein